MLVRGNDSGAVSMQEDLKDLDGVGNVFEERVDGQVGAETVPDTPMAVGGAGSRSGNSETDCVLSSTEVTQERSSCGTVHRRQECFCG